MRLVRSGLVAALTLLTLGACQGDPGSSSSGTEAAGATDGSTTAAATPSTSRPASGPELAFQADGSIWIQPSGEARENGAPDVPTDNQHPDWSPDGTQIAFEGNFTKIWTVGGDGGDAQERFSCAGPCTAVFEPAWSPDGTLLAFIHIVGDGTHTLSSQLMTLDLGTGATAVVHEDTAGDVWEYTPRWSSDGSQVVLEHDVFASNLLDEEQTLSSELRVVDTGTGVATPVPGTDGGQSPDWSPVDETIVYSDGGNLFTIRPDGTDRKRLTHFAVDEQSALHPTFTPDGTGVVFTWIQGVKDSGTETTVPGIVELSDGSVTAIEEAEGATHARIRP